MKNEKSITGELSAEGQTSHGDHTRLAAGLLVRRNSDGVLGTIEKFGHRFGTGARAYNAYWVRWADGKLGYPNESDFQPCS